jgi:hypothetical protein
MARVSGSNPNTKEHKARVLGDSHLKETGTRIDQFLTSKFEVGLNQVQRWKN